MDVIVDGDTIDLLTKRFNGSKNYSELSKEVFNELNQLSEIPKHRSSMKFSYVDSRMDTVDDDLDEDTYDGLDEDTYVDDLDEDAYDDDLGMGARELLNRMESLAKDIQSGYYSTNIQREFLDTLEQLYGRNIITETQMRQLEEKYCW